MDKLIYCVLLSDILGTLIYLIWKLFEKRYDRQEYVTALYAGLHLVVALVFIIMVLGIASDLYVWNLPQYDRLWLPTPALICVGTFFSCLWLAGAVCMMAEFFWLHIVHYLIIRSLFHADVGDQKALEQVKASLGIGSRSISLYTGYAITTPEMTGFLHPKVCIPAGRYTEDSLRNILVHELIHYKYKDKWIRELGILVMCIHWFNPLIRKMVRSLEWWDEVHCDACVCDHVPVYGYGQTLLLIYDRIRDNRQLYENMAFISISFSETGYNMLERLKRIMKHQSSIRQKRKILVPMTLAFTLILAGTALAAEPLIRKAGTQAYTLTAYETIEDDTYPAAGEADDLIEYEEVWDEAALAAYDIGITPYADSSATINISMANNVWRSGAFWASSGRTITVLVSIDPSDVEIKVGIVDPDGIYRYVPGSDVVNHPFPLTKSGFYQVVIKNETDTTVTVIGSYVTSSTSN